MRDSTSGIATIASQNAKTKSQSEIDFERSTGVEPVDEPQNDETERLGETRREIKRLEKINVQWDDFVDQLDKLVLDIEGIPTCVRRPFDGTEHHSGCAQQSDRKFLPLHGAPQCIIEDAADAHGRTRPAARKLHRGLFCWVS